ncbi:MAG: nucleotide exchange factor GrpE [Patescibacteria group bacterium]
MNDTNDDFKGKTLSEDAQNSNVAQPLDTMTDGIYSDDVQFESTDESGENQALVLKKMREKLHTCESEKKEYLDGWQRMRADFANARKEEDARRGDLIKFASEGLVEDMLPILDSFGMAFANKESWEKVDANWRKGVEYIHSQLLSVLESRGLAPIGMVGEKVDPRLHIAIDVIPTKDEKQEDVVAEVIQKGYRLHSKVIRPAKVKVFGHLEKDSQ